MRSPGAGIGRLVWVDVDVTAAWFTVSTKLATCVNPPPVPVTVSVNEPVDVLVGSVTVRVD